MQGWPTVGNEIVREVLFGCEIDMLLIDRRLEGGRVVADRSDNRLRRIAGVAGYENRNGDCGR